MDVATLHIRNVPIELFEQLQRWASERDRSINAEVIDLIRRESDRRHEETDAVRALNAYFEKYCDQSVDVDVVALIHEGRERAWVDEYET